MAIADPVSEPDPSPEVVAVEEAPTESSPMFEVQEPATSEMITVPSPPEQTVEELGRARARADRVADHTAPASATPSCTV